MITIKDTQTGIYLVFEVSRFPDGTSQVWKIFPPPEELSNIEVIWTFENEAEFFHICQLGYLLTDSFKCFPTLTVPFMPFSRQDKKVSNNQTFARLPFLEILKHSGYSRVNTYDVHSSHPFVNSISVKGFHDTVIPKDAVICYPDLGATGRYQYLNLNHTQVFFHKVRNQETGEIQGLVLQGAPEMIEGKNIYIVDDICDGGATFIGVTNELKKYKPEQINLVVTHGIFSKGTKPLLDAGIKGIYTTNSLIDTENFFGVNVIPVIERNIDFKDLKRQDRKMI